MQARMNTGRRNTIGSPTSPQHPQRRRNTRRQDDDDDEMRRAIEASKRQADEDERKRRGVDGGTEDDLARAIKLSKEEEEMRRNRQQEESANLLFDDSMDQQTQPAQPLYQQQQEVDFWVILLCLRNNSNNRLATFQTFIHSQLDSCLNPLDSCNLNKLRQMVSVTASDLTTLMLNLNSRNNRLVSLQDLQCNRQCQTILTLSNNPNLFNQCQLAPITPLRNSGKPLINPNLLPLRPLDQVSPLP